MSDLTYGDVYKNLDGMIALQVAASMPLRKHRNERDTEYVKRIVATYVVIAARNGVHDLVGSPGLGEKP